jgi:hypothetical protein
MPGSFDTYFKPGDVHNPNGRPIGSRNKRTTEVLELIRAQGHKDPLVTLSELQDHAEDEGIRASAANMLAPYLHSKLAAKPQPPDPVYVERALNLPRPTTLEIALDNISRLTEMKAQGQLDFATADSFINDNRIIADKLIDEEKLRAQVADPNREQSIRIEGGLPPLLGTDIIMPKLNGREAPAVTHIELPEAHIPADYNAGDPPGGDYNGGAPPTEQEP